MTKKLEKLADVLGGKRIRGNDDGSKLADLYRTITHALQVSPIRWNRGLRDMLSTAKQTGHKTKAQASNKLGNLNDALCREKMSWLTFIDGLRLLVFAYRGAIKCIKFQVVIEHEENGKVKEHTFSTTVHNEKGE